MGDFFHPEDIRFFRTSIKNFFSFQKNYFLDKYKELFSLLGISFPVWHAFTKCENR